MKTLRKICSVLAAGLFGVSAILSSANVVAAQSLPTPTFGAATVQKTTSPTLTLNSSTSGAGVNSVLGQKLGATQWRLGLGGSTDLFQVDRYVGGVLVDSPLSISNATGDVTVTGDNFLINDLGRVSQTDNAASMTITSTEGVGFASYVTNYGLYIDRHQTSTGKGDRIGAGIYQQCDATLAGKSCVGAANVAIAGGSGVGGYIGGNAIVKVPPGLTGPASVATGLEVDTQTHSPVAIKNGLRIADENMFGSATTHGTLEDAAIAIVTSDFFGFGGLGYKVGIQFGETDQGYPGNWPILAAGTLIQANNPNVKLDYGFDMKGSAQGFNGAAIALPVNAANNNLTWGNNKQGGNISSTATSVGPRLTFTDNGLFLNTSVGAGIMGMFNDGHITFGASAGVSIAGIFNSPLFTPASSSAACTAGQFANDASFHYVCTATNTWKRVALVAF